MAVYKPVSDEWRWVEDRIVPPTMTVLVDETPPRSTGLLDAAGNRLVAVTVREPIGFIKFD